MPINRERLAMLGGRSMVEPTTAASGLGGLGSTADGMLAPAEVRAAMG